VIKPCALGPTRTHGDEATSGTSGARPGLSRESADSWTSCARPALEGLIIDALGVYFVLVLSVCVCLHGWREARQRIPGAWLACVLGCVGARDLCAWKHLHRGRETRFFPSACESALGRGYGPWLSSRWLAPGCGACGEHTPRERWGACGAVARPCAGRDWHDGGPAAGPWRALCRHGSDARDSGPPRRHQGCLWAMEASGGPPRRGR
jgi:hypothetical protein